MVWGEISLELGMGYLKRGYDHDRGCWRAADSDGGLSCQGEKWVCGAEIYDWNGVCMFELVGLIYLRMIKLVCVCCRDT